MPFHILCALIFTYTVYGMAGLRPGAVYIARSGVISSLMYLIAVQVRGRQGGARWGAGQRWSAGFGG